MIRQADECRSDHRAAIAGGGLINSRLKIAAFGLRPAGSLALLRAPYISPRVCSSRAPRQRAWGPAAKCTGYFDADPKLVCFGSAAACRRFATLQSGAKTRHIQGVSRTKAEVFHALGCAPAHGRRSRNFRQGFKLSKKAVSPQRFDPPILICTALREQLLFSSTKTRFSILRKH